MKGNSNDLEEVVVMAYKLVEKISLKMETTA